MADFDEFYKALEIELLNFADYSWHTYKNAALNDGRVFLIKYKDDLLRWTRMLEKKELTRDDFEWLVMGKKDQIELESLKQKGLAKVALDRFTHGLIDTIVATAFKTFL